MKKLFILSLPAIMLLFPACKSASQATADTASSDVTKSVAISMPIRNSGPDAPPAPNVREAKMIPKATAFKMSGDYAGNVAITVDSQGNLTYFPAPSDISTASEPVALADGWWLNRQGIGINSVFTKYTFAEYAALPSVPTIAELKEAIIPGARVTEVIQLPYNLNEAADNIPSINEFLQKQAARSGQPAQPAR